MFMIIPPKRLILMQGIPGSGKTTVARHMATALVATAPLYTDEWRYEILSTDAQRISKCGHYVHDASKNGEHHAANQRLCVEAMQAEVSFIFIDNTNITKREAAPYIALAKMFGYEVQVLSVQVDVVEAKRRNAQRSPDRRVPDEVIEDMHARMEPLL